MPVVSCTDGMIENQAFFQNFFNWDLTLERELEQNRERLRSRVRPKAVVAVGPDYIQQMNLVGWLTTGNLIKSCFWYTLVGNKLRLEIYFFH